MPFIFSLVLVFFLSSVTSKVIQCTFCLILIHIFLCVWLWFFMCRVSKSIVIYIIKSILILFNIKWSCTLGLEFLSGLTWRCLHQCFINIWYALYLDCNIFVSPFSSLKLLNCEQTLNSDSNFYYKEKKKWLGKNQWLVEELL